VSYLFDLNFFLFNLSLVNCLSDFFCQLSLKANEKEGEEIAKKSVDRVDTKAYFQNVRTPPALIVKIGK
jgi:hypothetical protein